MPSCTKCGAFLAADGSHVCPPRLTWEDYFWRFWLAVDKKPATPDGCWLWMGALNSMGYGWTPLLEEGTRARRVLAHRYAYFLGYGDFPKELCVLHRCDTPRCCRPDHLFLGTKKENSQDMAAKGRQYLQKASREVQLASAANMRAKRRW